MRGRGSLAREYTITYRPALERNETVVAGRVLGRDAVAPHGEVSIEESLRERFRINVGDTMRFDVMGRVGRGARDAASGTSTGPTAAPAGSCSCSAPALLDKAPHGFISFFRGPDDGADARAAAGRAGRRAYPNVSVIDGREMLTTIRTVIDNVTLAVTVVGSLVVFSGLLILIGAVAMTKFRRIYEAAIFKTLGATRRTIASVLLLEYGVLGRAGRDDRVGRRDRAHLGHQPLRARHPVAAAAARQPHRHRRSARVLVAVVGVAASWEVLQRKPLATLRAE